MLKVLISISVFSCWCKMHSYGCSDSSSDSSYNIQFVIDESGSVGQTNYQSSVEFIQSLISNQIDAYPTNISVYSFNHEVEQLWSFKSNENDKDRTLLQSTLDFQKTQYNGTGTYTKQALETSISDFENTPGITTSDINIICLLTDGIPADAPCPKEWLEWWGDYYYEHTGNYPTTLEPLPSTEDMWNRLNAYNIRIIILGIGEFDVKPIECLATDDDVFSIDGFTASQFDDLEQTLSKAVFECIEPIATVAPAESDENDFYLTNNFSLGVIFGGLVGVIIGCIICCIKGVCCGKRRETSSNVSTTAPTRTMQSTTEMNEV